MHPCRNAMPRTKVWGCISPRWSTSKMSLPIHGGNSDEPIWRPRITQANPAQGCVQGCGRPVLQGRLLGQALSQENTHVKWTQGISGAIWTSSSSCPWLATDASLTAPSFQLPSPWLLLRSAGLEFCCPGFFPSGNYFSFLLTIRTQRKRQERKEFPGDERTGLRTRLLLRYPCSVAKKFLSGEGFN